MSRYMVDAEFVTDVPADQWEKALAFLNKLLAMEGGSAFARPDGWSARIGVSMQPSPADAASTAGDTIRAAARHASMPGDSRMIDVHVRRIGGSAKYSEEAS